MVGKAFVVSAVAAMLIAGVSAAATAPTPQALYKALLAKSISSAALPPGFDSATTDAGTPTSHAARHHAVGVVEVSVDYGQTVLDYVIFSTHQDALADWQDSNFAGQDGVKSQQPATGFPSPGLIVNGSISSTDALNNPVSTGFTALGFVDGNVGVTIMNVVNKRRVGGNVQHTTALGQVALSHLHAIEAKLGH